MLRDRLAAACAGSGGLILIGGEAGVGKTALAEALCAEARQHGALVLVGHCYDLSETPPYGPWTEARSQFPPVPGSPPGSVPPLPDAFHTDARSPQQFVAEVCTFFAAAAARQPLLLLLDDMQWADPASLDLLRFLARSLATLPLLLVVNYRPDDLDAHHPFSQLLPLLVREAHAERIDLAPLTAEALQALVCARYRLGAADEARLVMYLMRRTEGNALFATEMLRALEERGVVATGGETLGELEGMAVPTLLRQIVAARVARLGGEAERLLAIAAVIGQQVPLGLWAAAAGSDEGAVETVAEQGLAARLLVETPEGVEFAHALIREALYAGIPALRRRRIHRATGEALAAIEDAAPDATAYHFQQAGDTRAGEWLTRAAWRAYRSFAYATARARFEAALSHVGGTERVRILLALSSLDRFREQGMRYAEEAVATARAAGDAELAALAQFRFGIIVSYHGLVGEALQAMEEAERVLETIPDDALPEFYDLYGLALVSRRSFRASALGYTGRWKEAFVALGEAPETVLAHLGNLPVNGAVAVWTSFILLGRPADARQVAAAILTSLAARREELAMLLSHVNIGVLLMIPFLLDDRETRQRYEAEMAGITRRVDEAVGAVPPLLNRCPLLIVTGEWAEARALWGQRRDAALTSEPTVIFPYVGAMARAQGERDEAWALVREGLPDGLRTEPGSTHYTAVDLYCLATRLALDDGDVAQARQWLEAHDRWLDWAGPEVRWGRADGQIAWAEYHRALGDPASALRHAERALAAASTPRQPLALLAAHRLLGELATDAGRFAAADSLQASLALADACAAPYERALTLLARAELHSATGDGAAARRLLTEMRALCTPLGAQPALARAERLVQRLIPRGDLPALYPAGLSVREVEVLRLLAVGRSNPEIATALSLSVRTIERHVENLYRKIGVHGRAEATAYAFRHDLT
jgi:DNA-binding CsgD family transcriptional regulator